MEQKSPEFLYHYTSINTLGHILKNKNIRFNNLCTLDDMDEGIFDGTEWGKYCFVSSWTSEKKESIEMWKMYSSDMNGIRIRLKSYPFEDYEVDQHKVIIPEDEYDSKRYLISMDNQENLLHKVIYDHIKKVDIMKNINPLIKEYEEAESFIYNTEKIGIYKNIYWKFQKEWRYVLHILPFDWTVATNPRHLYNHINMLPNLPFSDYYLSLDKKAFNSMEILVGPRANDIDIKIVELLVKEYNPTAKIKISCLKNRVR
jgi:hypothetical protein